MNDLIPTVHISKEEKKTILNNGFTNSWNLILEDRSFFIKIFLFFSIFPLISMLIASKSSIAEPIFSFLEQIVECIVTYLIFIKVFNSQTLDKINLKNKNLFVLISIEALFFFVILCPVLVFSFTDTHFIKVITAFSFLFFYFLFFFLYFYFVPVILNEYQVKGIIEKSKEYIKFDLLLPLKVIITPLAISSLLNGLLRLPFPDGRLYIVDLLQNFSFGLEKTLIIYISVCVSIEVLRKLSFKPVGLSATSSVYETNKPNFNQKLLDLFGNNIKNIPANFLSPRFGMFVLLLGGFIWMLGYNRLNSLKPTPDINIQCFDVQDNKIKVLLNISDLNYNFRGFTPYFLRIGSEKGTSLDKSIESINLNDSNFENIEDFRNTKINKLEMTFETDRLKVDALKLTDIYLYYRSYKISKIDFGNENTICK